jgi:alpha-glucosidase
MSKKITAPRIWHWLSLALWLLLGSRAAAQQSSTHTLHSPNGQLSVRIETAPALRWQLLLRGKPLSQPAPLALRLAGIGTLGDAPVLEKTAENRLQGSHMPPVWQKSALIEEDCNELTLHFVDKWGLAFRAYDAGIAYRFFTRMPKETLVVEAETLAWQPVGCQQYLFPEEEGFYSHNERVYQALRPEAMHAGRLASLPLLCSLEGGVRVLLTETDLQDYPGLWVQGTTVQDGRLQGVFPHYPKNSVRTSNRDVRPVDREPFLARTRGERTFPWRLFLVAERDEALLSNQMPWLLAEPSRLRESAWIRPGKVAWDWWNNLNLSDVDFPAGVNTMTYKHFIDFAAENGLEYVILDEGWSQTDSITKIMPGVDMEAIAMHARARGVGLILWVTWIGIERHREAILPYLKRWGIKGLKIDFMQRDDQEMVQFYWRMAEWCARHQLLVDFHGAHKPAGLQRTWPNVLSFEGVYGLEQCKWDKLKRIDPEHDVTLPFIRQVAGPMDYTPGAMLNYQRDDWSPSWSRPASLGTRCHELAKYVVYESPLQMLADSPSNYRKEPECLQFLAKVPAVWQKTVPLPSQVGDFVALARQAPNGLWYLAAMSDWTARDLDLDTRFLPPGEYALEIFEDGPNAQRNAQDYQRRLGHLKSGDNLRAAMAPGGGFVAILKKHD